MTLRAEVAAAVAAARPDDRRSWWTTVDGREVCNRVNYINEPRRSWPASAPMADSPASPRWVDPISGTPTTGWTATVWSSRCRAPSGGLADLPWHRDCGMGGHPVKCPMLNVGIQLDAATPETGQLQLIPGSHRGTSRLPGPREAAGLPVTPVSTEPGDVTVHFGHTLHAAPPPTDPRASGRKALYLTFVPPAHLRHGGPGPGLQRRPVHPPRRSRPARRRPALIGVAGTTHLPEVRS